MWTEQRFLILPGITIVLVLPPSGWVNNVRNAGMRIKHVENLLNRVFVGLSLP